MLYSNKEKLKNLSINELRARLYEAGIEYKDTDTKEQLIKLIEKYC